MKETALAPPSPPPPPKENLPLHFALTRNAVLLPPGCGNLVATLLKTQEYALNRPSAAGRSDHAPRQAGRGWSTSLLAGALSTNRALRRQK